MKSDQYQQITGLLHDGQRQQAIDLLEASRGLLSKQEYSECQGNIRFYDKDYQGAIPFFEAAIEGGDGYEASRYHYLIGVQLEQAGKLSDAFQRYQAAIEIEPSFVDSYIELGGLLFKVKDYPGAYQCYSDAVRLDPNDLGIHHNLIQVLTELEKEDTAKYGEALAQAQATKKSAEERLPEPRNNRIW